MAHGSKAHLQAAFLNALLAMPTIEQAARHVGVAKSTAQRWLQSPSFQAQYAEARRQALGETLAYLQRSMLAAVAKLHALLLDPDSKPIIQLGAARALLEYGLRASELEHVIERMERLEAHFLAQKGTP